MMGSVSFDELRTARDRLRDAVATHDTSIRWFKHPDRSWFVREEEGREREFHDPDPQPVRHLTSSATCLESLSDPLVRRTPDETTEIEEIVAEFAEQALSHADNDDTWSSENAARVYCRVRTLTPILALAPRDVVAKHQGSVRRLAREVWASVDTSNPKSQGVTEQSTGKNRQPYPPNAFHTYWAVRMLVEWRRHEERLGSIPSTIGGKRPVAELWARQMLAMQTALIQMNADRVDAHQLAWALSTEFLDREATPVTASTPRLELYRGAVEAYFRAQLPSGGWPLYEPLFHYPAAGNAYCYTFETLAALLRPALHEDGGRVLRDLLRPYLPNLLAAWRFAERTRIELVEGVTGWCSGHHPHRSTAEAWATASVFSYMQQLRCLVGHWTAEEAAKRRRARRPRKLGVDAAKLLGERGDLWVEDGWSPGRQLTAMFVNPIQARVPNEQWIDPDRPLILEDKPNRRDQARSAILFGPPGTGKTTLVEAVAGAIDWKFVEVLASDFLSDGMDKVPAKADEIFDQLMELDHCVVLFDEIDELIRNRDDESDPFGRFLTTSMLPKLAKLWEQRRILFFVATNDVDAADAAIKRHQRFDARIFVTPPAFHVKQTLLEDALARHAKKFPEDLKPDVVAASLQKPYAEADPYGVFALLRYDQIPELASLMAREANGSESISNAAAKAALAQMGSSLRAVEWNHPRHDPYALYRHHRQNESYDNRMVRLARVPPKMTPIEGLNLFKAISDSLAYATIANTFRHGQTPDGQWTISVDGRELKDAWRLDFANEG